MTSAKVSNKGQITLPVAARRKLGIEPNSRVEVVVRDDEIVIRPLKTIAELDGIFHKYVHGHKPVPWEKQRRQMEQAVAREVEDE
jgi:AbrB family looped-hinge helix DNA binding protein